MNTGIKLFLSLTTAGIHTYQQSQQARKTGSNYSFTDGLKNFVITGAGTGLTLEVGNRVISHLTSNTRNYFLCDNETPVYTGVVYDDRKEDRIKEHKRNGKEFTHHVFCDDLKPRPKALKDEKEIITFYKNSGQKLKYNIQHNK